MPDQVKVLKPEINVTFSLLDIKCTSFILSEYAISNKIAIPAANYEFLFDLNIMVLDTAREIQVTMSCKLFRKEENVQKEEIADLHVRARFLIHNFHDIFLRDTVGNYLIPNPVLALCNGMTVSTVRGMYLIKLENTLYANALLPVVDPASFIPKETVQQLALTLFWLEYYPGNNDHFELPLPKFFEYDQSRNLQSNIQAIPRLMLLFVRCTGMKNDYRVYGYKVYSSTISLFEKVEAAN